MTFTRREVLASGAAAGAGLAIGRVPRAQGKKRRAHRLDAHGHFLPDLWRQAAGDQFNGYPLPSWSRKAALRFMRRHRIQKQLVSLPDPSLSVVAAHERSALAVACNDAAADLVSSNSHRFAALATLALTDSATALAELTRSLDTLGLSGVSLPTSVDGTSLGDPSFQPVLAALNSRAAFVQLHPVPLADADKPEQLELPDGLIENAFEPVRAVEALIVAQAFTSYPNIRWCMAHGGGTVPYLAWRMAVLDQVSGLGNLLPILKGLTYDTALASGPGSIATMRALVPLEQIALGTDWPMTGRRRPDGHPQRRLRQSLTRAELRSVDRNLKRLLPSIA